MAKIIDNVVREEVDVNEISLIVQALKDKKNLTGNKDLRKRINLLLVKLEMMLHAYSEHNADEQREKAWKNEEQKKEKTNWVSPHDPGDEND